jgi:hypothetical protein
LLLTKLSLARNNKIYPARERLVSAIPAGDGKTANLFLQCIDNFMFFQGEEQIRQAELIKSRNCIHLVGVDYVQDDGFDE